MANPWDADVEVKNPWDDDLEVQPKAAVPEEPKSFVGPPKPFVGPVQPMSDLNPAQFTKRLIQSDVERSKKYWGEGKPLKAIIAGLGAEGKALASPYYKAGNFFSEMYPGITRKLGDLYKVFDEYNPPATPVSWNPYPGMTGGQVSTDFSGLKPEVPASKNEVLGDLGTFGMGLAAIPGGPRAMISAQEGLRAIGSGSAPIPFGIGSIKPKVAKYVNEAPLNLEESLNKFGPDVKERSKAISQIIADERLQGNLSNPELLRKASLKRAQEYAGAAQNTANAATLKNMKSGQDALVNPVEHIRTTLEDKLNSLRVPGDLNTNRAALRKVIDDMTEKGFNGDVTQNLIIDFKQKLYADMEKSVHPTLEESALNRMKKEAYFAADDLIKDPVTRQNLKKSADLFKITDMLEFQKASPSSIGGALKTLGPVIAGHEISSLVPGASIAEPVGLTLGAMLGGVALHKSGLPGRLALGLGNIGRPAQDILAMPIAQQQQLMELGLRVVQSTKEGKFPAAYAALRNPPKQSLKDIVKNLKKGGK